MLTVATVSVVWFTNTSWRRDQVFAPYRIKKQIYKNRELAIAEVADYIETFYNQTRRHSDLGGLSPEQFEAAHTSRRQGLH